MFLPSFAFLAFKICQQLTLVNILDKRARMKIQTVRLVLECRVWSGIILRSVPEASELIPSPSVEIG